MRSGRHLAALLAAVAVGTWCIPGDARAGQVRPLSSGPGRSSPMEPNGWQPVFASDFSGESLPGRCTVFDGPAAGQTASYYRPDEVQVSGGMLRLGIRRRDFSDRPYTAGGLGCRAVSQLYGRYEYRARVAPGAGIGSYVTLWPEETTSDDVTIVEVSAQYGEREAAKLSNAYGREVTRKQAGGEYADGFHDYVIEWAPTGLRVIVDDQVRLADDRASGAPRWFGFAVGTGDLDTGLPDRAVLPAEFLVDWVRVYSYAPGVAGPAAAGADGTGQGGSDADRAAADPPSRGGRQGAADSGASDRAGSPTRIVVALLAVGLLVGLAGYGWVRRTRRRSTYRGRALR